MLNNNNFYKNKKISGYKTKYKIKNDVILLAVYILQNYKNRRKK